MGVVMQGRDKKRLIESLRDEQRDEMDGEDYHQKFAHATGKGLDHNDPDELDALRVAFAGEGHQRIPAAHERRRVQTFTMGHIRLAEFLPLEDVVHLSSGVSFALSPEEILLQEETEREYRNVSFL